MTTWPRRSRWMFGAISLALLLFVGWLAFNRPITATLPDGTTFELSYLSVALTNEVFHGTFLGRVAESWIPPNGWKVGKFEVKRPQRLTLHNQGRSDLLVAAIKLRPGSPRERNLMLPLPNRPLRFQVIGDDGYGYVEDFANFSSYPDGVIAHIVTPRFPRNSAKLRFRLEERHPEAPTGWREIATLIAPNPKPAKGDAWTADEGRRIKLAEGVEMELGELTIATHVPDPQQPSAIRALLPVRFWIGGQLSTNWGLYAAAIRDALGNHESTTFSSYWSNGWVCHPIQRPLNPHVPWRFDAQVARTTDFPETNLFTFGLNHGKPFSTNCAEIRTSLSFAGHGLLRVKLTERPAEVRLSVISARWRGQEMLRDDGTHNQHHFQLSPPKPASWTNSNLAVRPATFPQSGGLIVPPGGVPSRIIGSGVNATSAQKPAEDLIQVITDRLRSGVNAPSSQTPVPHFEQVPSHVIRSGVNATARPVNVGPHSVEVTLAIHPNYPVQFTIHPKLDSAPPLEPGQ